MEFDGRSRVVIQQVKPEINGGKFPAKRAVGEPVRVRADIFCDGHDKIDADLLWKKEGGEAWRRTPMKLINNDLWEGIFVPEEKGAYRFTIEAWVDHYETWQADIQKKEQAGLDLTVDMQIGVEFLDELLPYAEGKDASLLSDYRAKIAKLGTKGLSLALSQELTELVRKYSSKIKTTRYLKELQVKASRKKGLFSTWYELFPRSCSPKAGRHGTFRDVIGQLPKIKRMGFDVLYLPPIHPIGKVNRKGKNNNVKAAKGDPGSPWAIASHDTIHEELGTLDDFQQLVKAAGKEGIEVAMDIAFQCSPDHPYVKEHPEWFRWRPDGTVQFAENPPKKYEDIIPFNFETEAWRSLWEELKRVFLFWVEQGVQIFRVDNPHTKPLHFWEWVIGEVKEAEPDVIFLSEAFTRPKVMQYLAKAGFDQSYTYFTWRNTKHELIEYVTELTRSEMRQYFRPNFWPNTPDILPQHLQFGGKPAFMARLVLAATLSSNYGIYALPFERCVSAAVGGKEEYLDSEKYEIKHWDRTVEGDLEDLIALVNQVRQENGALQTTWNIEIYEISNEALIAYGKYPVEGGDPVVVVVNLDPFHTQSGMLALPLEKLGIAENQPYLVHDLISDDRYIWEGSVNYVELNPHQVPAHILRVHSHLKREQQFEHYM